MADIIVIIILVLLIGSSAAYMIRAKKNGVKCIGCPAGGSCPGSGKVPKKKLAAVSYTHLDVYKRQVPHRILHDQKPDFL